jgi:hypothetical protein
VWHILEPHSVPIADHVRLRRHQEHALEADTCSNSHQENKQKVHRNFVAPLLLKVDCEEVDAAHELDAGHVTFFPYVAFVPLSFLGGHCHRAKRRHVFLIKPRLIVEEKKSCGRADIRDVLIRQDEFQRWRNSRPIIVVFRILQRTCRQTDSQTAAIAIHKPNK